MLTLRDLQWQVQWEDKSKSPARAELVRSLTNQVWFQIWSSGLYEWRKKRGEIRTQADLTGTASVSNGSTAATVAGLTMAYARVWDHVRFSTDDRVYQIVAFNGTTGITLDVPYEGTTDTAATCRIFRKWHRFPADMDAIETIKESAGGRIVAYSSGEFYEASHRNPVTAGQPYEFRLAGVTSDKLHGDGTFATTRNSGALTGTSSALVEARDKGRRIVFDGYPYHFTITAVASATSATIKPAWPFDAMTDLTYQIDPPGEPLFEAYPTVNSASQSFWFWYWAKMPFLVRDNDTFEGLPEQFHYILVEGVLEKLGLRPPGTLKVLMGELNAHGNIARNIDTQMGQYKPGGGGLPHALTSDYPFFNPLTGG